jgi:UDP-N-acetylmuramate dehydrogenase
MRIIENYNLKHHNTFGFEIFAKKFFEYKNERELIVFLQNNSDKILHIGGGSNLLFLNDFDGAVLHSAIKFIEILEQNNDVFVRVGAGIIWDDFCKKMVEKGFGGAENLSLIPGEAGAAAVQNIGAYGIEIQDIICKVEGIEIATSQKKIFDVTECRYDYRESIFKKDLKGKFIVTAVVFRLSKNPILKLNYGALKERLKNIENPDIQHVRDAVIEIRQNKLPDTKILGNSGSFFKNPYC